MHKKILYLIITVFFLSCNQRGDLHNHDHETDAHEEHEVKSITMIQGGFEIFLEYTSLVVGEVSDFSIHVTRLETYKPLAEGKVILSLVKDKKGIRNSSSPDDPGIFKLSLQPKEVGFYTMNIEVTSGQSAGVTLTVDSIEVVADHSELHDSHAKNDNGNEITFLKQQSWKTEFSIQEIVKKPFREVINTSGQLLPAIGDEQIIIANHSGVVNLKSRLLEGKHVKTGDVLLTIGGQGIAEDNMQVHFIELKSNFELAKANYKRMKALAEDRIVNEGELLKAKTQYDQAKAAYEIIEHTEKGAFVEVKANRSGFVSDIFVSDGQFVEGGARLAAISQNKKLLMRADVSQTHWDCLPDIRQANFKVPGSGQTFNISDFNGKLVSYGKTANHSAWSTPVYFELDNNELLIPGTFVEVFLLSNPKPDVISVPESAFIEEQGNLYVFVQLSGETYEKRLVRTGISNGKEVEITSGLKEGEIIVDKGAYQIKLASMSSSIPAHNHDH